jgi:hypothetical protein
MTKAIVMYGDSVPVYRLEETPSGILLSHYSGVRCFHHMYMEGLYPKLPLVMNRVMSKTRSDYPEYCRKHGLTGQETPLEELVKTGGHKATDQLWFKEDHEMGQSHTDLPNIDR